MINPVESECNESVYVVREDTLGVIVGVDTRNVWEGIGTVESVCD